MTWQEQLRTATHMCTSTSCRQNKAAMDQKKSKLGDELLRRACTYWFQTSMLVNYWCYFSSWVVSPCECGQCCRCFGSTYCIHLWGWSVRCIYIMFQKTRRNEWRSEKLVPSGTTGTVNFTALTRQGPAAQFSRFTVAPAQNRGHHSSFSLPIFVALWNRILYIHNNSHSLHTSTMKMEAVYTSETSSRSIWCIIPRTKLTSLSVFVTHENKIK